MEGWGRGREDSLEATYKYIKSTHVNENTTLEGLRRNLVGPLGSLLGDPSSTETMISKPLVSRDKSPPRAQMILRREGREKKQSKSFPWCKLYLCPAAKPSAPGALELVIDPSREQPG